MAEAEPLFWSQRVSLTTRILAVNVIALVLLAGSLFYLDSYRNRLIAERFSLARAEAQIAADALGPLSRTRRKALLTRVGAKQKLHLRLYDRNDALIADSFELVGPAFTFIDPAKESWYMDAARAIDRGVDFLVDAPPIPKYEEPAKPGGRAWPEIAEARLSDATVIRQRLAPDRTPVITAAVPVGTRGDMLLTMRNAPDITENIRDARQTLAIIIGAALLVSVLLSLFLARTIVQPLRVLVRAAIRVRLGRDREVVVPRLPDRRDEIGMLARAISDMSAALRQRIDAVESFAADVAHEIKNPLASLRSALESMERVEDAALRRQLLNIASHDVQRIDRLVTEVADASRIDAELSRTTFEPVDMVQLTLAIVAARDSRRIEGGPRIAVTHRGPGSCIVAGDPARLERVLENLLDNAASFSPPGAAIEIEIVCESHGDRGRVGITVADHGPGIPAAEREKVFERFHSLRPAGEDFGSHSGLGLAIARTIVEAHDGTLTVRDRVDGRTGVRLVIDLPAGAGPWTQAWQATCVAIGGRAILIEGPPGCGKSSLALALIDRGAVLVGDDGVLIERRGHRLIARPHPNTRGILEIRNLGLLPFPVSEEAPVALVAVLDEQAPRFVEQAERTVRAGASVPLLRLSLGGPVLHLKAELALTHFGLITG